MNPKDAQQWAATCLHQSEKGAAEYRQQQRSPDPSVSPASLQDYVRHKPMCAVIWQVTASAGGGVNGMSVTPPKVNQPTHCTCGLSALLDCQDAPP